MCCDILNNRKSFLPCANKHSYYKSNTSKKGFRLWKWIADLPNETAFAVSETDEGSVKLSGCFTHPAFIAGLSAVRRQGGFYLNTERTDFSVRFFVS